MAHRPTTTFVLWLCLLLFVFAFLMGLVSFVDALV